MRLAKVLVPHRGSLVNWDFSTMMDKSFFFLSMLSALEMWDFAPQSVKPQSQAKNLAKIGQHFSPLFRRKKGWVLPNLMGRQAAVLVRCLNRRHPGLSLSTSCHIIPSATEVKKMRSFKKILDVYFTNQRKLGGGCSRPIYDVGHRNTALQTSV